MRPVEHLITRCASSRLGAAYDPRWNLSFNGALSPGWEEQLFELYRLRNGFFAFESALHIFPIGPSPGLNVVDWNDNRLWKQCYEIETPEFFCFGENIFGEPFCIVEDSVSRFDPETGDFEYLAPTIDSWAELILEDFPFHTGHRLAHEWQATNKPIEAGYRLLPRIPFVCGGAFETANLIEVDAAQGMRSRASLANQIRDLPDGTTIRFVVHDD